jgi:small subunit ribosomal protein S2
VVIDVRREVNALREARTLGIPTVCLLDTDGDPDMVDIPIPCNDDAMRAIGLVLRELTDAALEGLGKRTAKREGADAGADEAESRPRRRSTRAQFRAGEPAEDESAEPAPAAEQAVAQTAGDPDAGAADDDASTEQEPKAERESTTATDDDASESSVADIETPAAAEEQTNGVK